MTEDTNSAEEVEPNAQPIREGKRGNELHFPQLHCEVMHVCRNQSPVADLNEDSLSGSILESDAGRNLICEDAIGSSRINVRFNRMPALSSVYADDDKRNPQPFMCLVA